VDGTAAGAAIDALQEQRRRVAESRAGPAREHARHPVPLAGEVSVSDGINAGVEPMQMAGSAPAADGCRGHAAADQLGAGDDPVLSRGELGCDEGA
jgi:hypothetical protein